MRNRNRKKHKDKIQKKNWNKKSKSSHQIIRSYARIKHNNNKMYRNMNKIWLNEETTLSFAIMHDIFDVIILMASMPFIIK